MKIKFDSSQAYQLEAVASTIDLFRGQPEVSAFTFEDSSVSSSGQLSTELGTGNRLDLTDEQLLENLQKIQAKHHLELTDAKSFAKNGLNFSIEMETGTGKTYVYLRSIFELHEQYGFTKFIIVVPSVAIREGVLKNIEITKEHFMALYNEMPMNSFVYEGKKINRLRQFATSNHVEIMIINIDAFRKDFSESEEENKKSNVIYKENDKLSGRKTN